MTKKTAWWRRATRVKHSLNQGRQVKPRLVVNRSHRHLYAQLIEPDGRVIAAVNSLQLRASGLKGSQLATQIGQQLAAQALKVKKVKQLPIVFDRRGYTYHGQVKALAEGARTGNLIF